jgi:hypothetical protein
MLETGWLVGIDGGWPERSFAERPGLNFGVVVGGDGGIACALEKPKGGKAPAAQSRSSLSRKENTAPKN